MTRAKKRPDDARCTESAFSVAATGRSLSISVPVFARQLERMRRAQLRRGGGRWLSLFETCREVLSVIGCSGCWRGRRYRAAAFFCVTSVLESKDRAPRSWLARERATGHTGARPCLTLASTCASKRHPRNCLLQCAVFVRVYRRRAVMRGNHDARDDGTDDDGADHDPRAAEPQSEQPQSCAASAVAESLCVVAGDTGSGRS